MEKYKLKIWAVKYRDYFNGDLVGAIIGYFYWKFVGCSSGHCRISSKPMNSMLYFGISGALLTSAFKKEEIK